MRTIILLGANYVRSQWIPVAVMSGYLLGAGFLFGWHQQRADVLFYLQWHSYNVIFVSMLIAVPAIWSERRSRRILAVLSKAVSRRQYLAGLLCGCAIMSGWFCLLVGVISAVLWHRGGIFPGSLPGLVLVVFLCCVMAESAGIFFSVFLHPLLAVIATSAFLLVPMAGLQPEWNAAGELFPVSAIIRVIRVLDSQNARTEIWGIAVAAVLEIVFFWAIGSALFARRDVTISPE